MIISTQTLIIFLTDGLITPDLWLKNCRSRSQTPISEPSRTPSPPHPVYSKPSSPHSISQINESKVKKPLITVAPVSKLLNKNFTSKPPLRTVKRRRLRPCRPSTFRNDAPIENNNNNSNKNPNLQEATRSGPNFPPETETNHPIRIAPPPPQPHIHTQPIFRPSHPLLRPPPPVTILVPYPILLPLVIPIPIPLPILKPTNWKKDENLDVDTKDSETNTTVQCTSKASEENVPCEKETDNEASQAESNKVDDNAEHKLPKFKITRLQSKRILTRECEKEKNRPLRKRKFDQHQIIELEDEKSKSK